MYIFVTIFATILLQTYLDRIKWSDTSHGITFTRSNEILLSYRCGDSFELNEFSMVDLDLNCRMKKKRSTVSLNNQIITTPKIRIHS